MRHFMTYPSALLASSLGLALVACGDSGPLAPDAGIDAPAGPPRAVIVAGDFTAGHPGILSTIDPATRAVRTNVGPALAVSDDPILRHIAGELLIVNRVNGNNVTILDDQTLALKEQLGTGAGSNPQDVAVIGNRLYVATFKGKGLVVLTRGSTAVTTIDLSADDPDGIPNCNSVHAAAGDIYVSCGLLDDTQQLFPPRGPGKVYVVDPASGAIKRTLTLGHKNPFGLFEQVPDTSPNNAGELWLPTVLFDDGSGCVERIVPGATPSAPGCVVDNKDMKGYASRISFQIAKDIALVFLAVPTTFPKSELQAYDLAISSLWAGALNPTTQTIGDLVVCPGGELVLADTTMNANGVRVYDGAAELTKSALAVGLPPMSTHGLVCY
jgi:hypothetical protein